MRRLLALVGAVFVALLVAASAFNLLALASVHRFTVRSTYPNVTSLRVNSCSSLRS